ncbi:hypothetical protein ACFLTK_01380 [Chloroflexota bacterium]
MADNFDKILDECIDCINHGESLESCLTDYPQYAEQLEPLLRVIIQAKESCSFQPSAKAKRAARQRFEQVREESAWAQEEKRSLFPCVFAWSQARAVVATAMLVALKGAKDTMIKGLVSRQPIWKTAVFGTLALALAIGLSLTMPSLSTESAYAADIVQNSPKVQAVLGDGEVEVVKVIVIGGKVAVIAKGKKGIVKADVDLKTRAVTDVEKMSATTAEVKQEAIDIAKADPMVKELLDTGAMISIVSPTWHYGMMDLETGEIEEISETYVKVVIEGIESRYVAYADLTKGKVVKLIDYSESKGS